MPPYYPWVPEERCVLLRYPTSVEEWCFPFPTKAEAKNSKLRNLFTCCGTIKNLDVWTGEQHATIQVCTSARYMLTGSGHTQIYIGDLDHTSVPPLAAALKLNLGVEQTFVKGKNVGLKAFMKELCEHIVRTEPLRVKQIIDPDFVYDRDAWEPLGLKKPAAPYDRLPRKETQPRENPLQDRINAILEDHLKRTAEDPLWGYKKADKTPKQTINLGPSGTQLLKEKATPKLDGAENASSDPSAGSSGDVLQPAPRQVEELVFDRYTEDKMGAPKSEAKHVYQQMDDDRKAEKKPVFGKKQAKVIVGGVDYGELAQALAKVVIPKARMATELLYTLVLGQEQATELLCRRGFYPIAGPNAEPELRGKPVSTMRGTCQFIVVGMNKKLATIRKALDNKYVEILQDTVQHKKGSRDGTSAHALKENKKKMEGQLDMQLFKREGDQDGTLVLLCCA